MSLTYVHFLLAGVLICSVSAFDDEDVRKANKYVDGVLEKLKKEPEVAKYIEPLHIPDFSDKSYKLRNIKVKGLSHLTRYGNCSLSYTNSTVHVIAEVAVSDISIEMDYSAKALFFWIHGEILITVEHLAVMVDITSTDGNASTDVNQLKVTNLGHYNVKKLNGFSVVFNWLVRMIANRLAQNARQNIISTLEIGGKNALNNVLKHYKLPLY